MGASNAGALTTRARLATAPTRGGTRLTGISAIEAGYRYTAALTADATVKAWGVGPLGNESSLQVSTPIDVLVAPGGVPLTGVTAIAGGSFHACALTSGGGVKCWGDNNNGRLGDGTTIARLTPVDVLTSPGGVPLSGVVAIAVENSHTCALTDAGAVKCWGANTDGQLGDDTTVAKHTPVDASGLSATNTSITAGLYHTCAVTSASGAKCWGSNYYGQLGVKSTVKRLTPVNVSGLATGVADVTAGGYFTCAFHHDRRGQVLGRQPPRSCRKWDEETQSHVARRCRRPRRRCGPGHGPRVG